MTNLQWFRNSSASWLFEATKGFLMSTDKQLPLILIKLHPKISPSSANQAMNFAVSKVHPGEADLGGGVQWDYPLVNIQKTMERSTIFHGKIHYFNGHFQ